MDDLQVKPMSSIASIALLNAFNVKDMDSLEEKTVSIGVDEVIINIQAGSRDKVICKIIY